MNKEWVKWCLVMALSLLFWGLALSGSEELAERKSSVSVRLPEGIVSGDFKQAVDAKYPPESYAIWNRTGAATAENQDLGKQTSITVIEFIGDMSLICPQEVIAGGVLQSFDKIGCVIDKASAEVLFGSSEVIGMPVVYEGSVFIIRGIIDTQEAVLLYQNLDDDRKYSNAEFRFYDSENGKLLAKQILQASGCYGGITLLEGGFYGKILKKAAMLPAQIIFVFLCAVLLARISEKRGNPLQRLYCILICIIPILLFAMLSGLHFYLPERLIPTRWSDLEFWSEKGRGFVDWLKGMESLDPIPQDILLRRSIMILFLEICFCIIFFVMWMKKDVCRQNRYLALSFFIPMAELLLFAYLKIDIERKLPYLLLFPAATAIRILNDALRTWKWNKAEEK